MTAKGLKFQLALLGCHCRNAAKQAICTFKNHFIAGLCSTDPKFPMALWCRLLQQVEITINLLRPSHINPKVSAYNQLFGIFDYNKTPIAPPGTHVLAYEDTQKRQSWGTHGRDGWYIAPAMEAYQCYKVYTNDTRAIITSNQVQWFPTKVKMPAPSTEDIIIAKLNDIVHALRHPAESAPKLSDNIQTAEKLEAIPKTLQNITKPTTAPLQPIADHPVPSPRVVPITNPPTQMENGEEESAPCLRVAVQPSEPRPTPQVEPRQHDQQPLPAIIEDGNNEGQQTPLPNTGSNEPSTGPCDKPMSLLPTPAVIEDDSDNKQPLPQQSTVRKSKRLRKLANARRKTHCNDSKQRSAGRMGNQRHQQLKQQQ